MTVERDIKVIAIPFTSGIVISAILFQNWQHLAVPVCSAAVFIAAISVAIFLHPHRNSLNGSALWAIAVILSFSCGYFTASTEYICNGFELNFFHDCSHRIRMFSESLKETISSIPFDKEDGRMLIKALITGDRSGLSKEMTTSFRESGASHILALSGFHLGIIYGILRFLLSFSGNSRPSRLFRAIVITSVCGFYTIATGAGASITRAFLFILLGELADLSGRFRNIRTILWASLLIQLTFAPEFILDIGFQLSYAAMAGIAYIYPRIRNLWPDDGVTKGLTYKLLKWIWNSASMSIACQLTTGPFVWMYFGTFPQYFLLTNLIALPLTSIIIPAGILTICLHRSDLCPEVLIHATEHLIDLMIQSLETIASL